MALSISKTAFEVMLTTLHRQKLDRGWGYPPTLLSVSLSATRTLAVRTIALPTALWTPGFGYDLFSAFAAEYVAINNHHVADKLFGRLKADSFQALILTAEALNPDTAQLYHVYLSLDVQGKLELCAGNPAELGPWPHGWSDEDNVLIARGLRDLIIGMAERDSELSINRGMLDSVFPGEPAAPSIRKARKILQEIIREERS